MSDQEFVMAPATVSVGFTLMPVEQNINSIMIVNQVEELSGFGEWAESTYRALSPERRLLNSQLSHMLLGGFEFEDNPGDFEQYLQRLRERDAVEARDSILNMLHEKCEQYGVSLDLTNEELLADEATFLNAIDSMFGEAMRKKGHTLDLETYRQNFVLLQNPALLKEKVVEHLTYMWETHLKEEWKRNLPMLEECIDAFEQLSFNGQTVLEATRNVTGRDMSEYWENFSKARALYFIPSPHVGPYNAYFYKGDSVYVIFGARIPRGVRVKSGALSRSELLVRLSALADDTRLVILELLTRHDELCAQDIIEMLNLSQSSASRHLRQLTATGYVTERRREVAKCYSLNPERVEDTLQALKSFMSKRS